MHFFVLRASLIVVTKTGSNNNKPPSERKCRRRQSTWRGCKQRLLLQSLTRRLQQWQFCLCPHMKSNTEDFHTFTFNAGLYQQEGPSWWDLAAPDFPNAFYWLFTRWQQEPCPTDWPHTMRIKHSLILNTFFFTKFETMYP